MKHATSLPLAIAALMLGCSANAQITESFAFTGLNRPIPDGNASGLSDTRAVGSTIVSLSSVRVRLNISGEFNADLYAYLTHESGICILLNRSGKSVSNPFGYDDEGFNVTFDDAATGDIHNYQSSVNPAAGLPLTGTWQPDARALDPANVLNTSPRTAFLDAFGGLNAAGDWTLFVADLQSGGTHVLNSWELELHGQAIPQVTWAEPSAITYGTALGTTQLNASANVPGTFAYTPPSGTVLNAGAGQILTAVFTPTDTVKYQKTTNTVTLDVNRAPLVITAQDKTKVYGAALPALTASYSGFVNGNGPSDLDTPVTLATSVTASSPAGNHVITASGAADANYAITHVNGTLSITKAASAGILGSSLNPAQPGQSVSLSLALTAVAPGAGTPTGTVQFQVNGAPFASPQPVVGGVATLNTTSLPVGSHTISAVYAGDGNFLGTGATLAQAQIVNTPPTAGPNQLERYAGVGVKVRVSELLGNDSDADGHQISLDSIDTSSAAGGVITVLGEWVHYTPPAGFNTIDTFTYQISDVIGATAVGVVTVVLKDDSGVSQNITAENLGNGSIRIRVYGIPGRTYQLEHTADLDNPSWTPMGDVTPGELGYAEVLDTPPQGAPTRYYRTVYSP